MFQAESQQVQNLGWHVPGVAGTARRPGLWQGGQVAGEEVGETARDWLVISVLS